MPDITVTINVQPTAAVLALAVPLTAAQANAVAFTDVLEISPDGGVTWFEASRSGCVPPTIDPRTGAPQTVYARSVEASQLPAAPTQARVTLLGCTDATLVPQLTAS